jgi:CHAT domain
MVAPVILAAFANDKADFLTSLQAEADAITDALDPAKGAGRIDLVVQTGATIGRLFTLMSKHGQDLVVFHYGGHANGSALNLQETDGSNVAAHGAGLAQLLGTLPHLKLVFLNGCATQGHVEQLLAAGVPAVIATSAPVEDNIALEFAKVFYTELANSAVGRTVDEAFALAKARVLASRDNAIDVEKRGMSVGADAANAEPAAIGAAKWGLYFDPGKAAELAWSLPVQNANAVSFSIAPTNIATQISTPNGSLLARLANAVRQYNQYFVETIEASARRNGGTPDERVVRSGVIDAYPAPIGKKLQALFSGGQMGIPRLPLLVEIYDITTRLIAFVLLAQLWDLFEDKAGAVTLTEAQWQVITQHNALDDAGAASFDYLAFAITLVAVLAANGATSYMQECAGLSAAFAQPDGAAAQSFMNEKRAALHSGSADQSQDEATAVTAGHHLEVAMEAMTFVVGYTLATIKAINIERTRRKKASFLHTRVLLDQATTDPSSDGSVTFTEYADNESVILLKNLNDVSSYLNLSPFVIDRNALTRNSGTNVYFFRYYDEAAAAVNYDQVSQGNEKLALQAVMPQLQGANGLAGENPLAQSGPAMLKLYQEFRSTVAQR